MLTLSYNAATDCRQIESWTPGPWTLPAGPGSRISGVSSMLDLPDPGQALRALGLHPVDEIVFWRIVPAAGPEMIGLRWPDDPAMTYSLFRESFAELWLREGVTAEAWTALWADPDCIRELSGVAEVQGEAAGFILAQQPRAQGAPVVYRTFGIHPAHRGRGLGLAVYQTSLARAARVGLTEAHWVTFASNAAISRLMDRLNAEITCRTTYWEATAPFMELTGTL